MAQRFSPCRGCRLWNPSTALPGHHQVNYDRGVKRKRKDRRGTSTGVRQKPWWRMRWPSKCRATVRARSTYTRRIWVAGCVCTPTQPPANLPTSASTSPTPWPTGSGNDLTYTFRPSCLFVEMGIRWNCMPGLALTRFLPVDRNRVSLEGASDGVQLRGCEPLPQSTFTSDWGLSCPQCGQNDTWILLSLLVGCSF